MLRHTKTTMLLFRWLLWNGWTAGRCVYVCGILNGLKVELVERVRYTPLERHYTIQSDPLPTGRVPTYNLISLWNGPSPSSIVELSHLTTLLCNWVKSGAKSLSVSLFCDNSNIFHSSAAKQCLGNICAQCLGNIRAQQLDNSALF